MQEDMSNTQVGGDLGPVIYGQRSHLVSAVFYIAGGVIPLILGVIGLWIPTKPPEPRYGMVICSIIMMCVGAWSLAIGWVRLKANLGASWHLHQRGVRLAKWGKDQVLLYEHVDELVSKLVRNYGFRVWYYESHDVTLKSHATGNAAISLRRIRGPKQLWGAGLNRPTELMLVCGHIAGLIANGMKVRMALGETITLVREEFLRSPGAQFEGFKFIAKKFDWLGTVRLRSDGIEIEESRTPVELLRWNQIDRIAYEGGLFHLWACGETRPVLKLRLDLPNLHAAGMVIHDFQRGQPMHVHPHVLTIL